MRGKKAHPSSSPDCAHPHEYATVTSDGEPMTIIQLVHDKHCPEDCV